MKCRAIATGCRDRMSDKEQTLDNPLIDARQLSPYIVKESTLKPYMTAQGSLLYYSTF
jgi:hypothetical protein